MVRIIIGILIIIGGLSGKFVLRGTQSGGALVVVGVISVIAGIVKLTGNNDESEQVVVNKTTDCIAKDEKITVYKKTHESLGVLTEIAPGTKFTLDLTNDFERFYKVVMTDGQTGYILKNSKVAIATTA